jgi:hypothetical protein
MVGATVQISSMLLIFGFQILSANALTAFWPASLLSYTVFLGAIVYGDITRTIERLREAGFSALIAARAASVKFASVIEWGLWINLVLYTVANTAGHWFELPLTVRAVIVVRIAFLALAAVWCHWERQLVNLRARREIAVLISVMVAGEAALRLALATDPSTMMYRMAYPALVLTIILFANVLSNAPQRIKLLAPTLGLVLVLNAVLLFGETWQSQVPSAWIAAANTLLLGQQGLLMAATLAVSVWQLLVMLRSPSRRSA